MYGDLGAMGIQFEDFEVKFASTIWDAFAVYINSREAENGTTEEHYAVAAAAIGMTTEELRKTIDGKRLFMWDELSDIGKNTFIFYTVTPDYMTPFLYLMREIRTHELTTSN